jgi:hypothetical protein
MQLAFSMFDALPEGFVPRVRERARRAVKPRGEVLVEVRQFSILDLLAMSEEQSEAEIGPIQWADSDISTLREAILREACHTLLDNRAAIATRRERWAWIQSDDWMPFSFKACAIECEVDYEELRVSLESLLRHHKALNDLVASAA